MILTGPKDDYCYVEVSREIRGGAQFLGKLEAIAGKVLGTQAVAATTEIIFESDNPDLLDVGYFEQPLFKPVGCEFPPPNELRLQLLHRGFDAVRMSRFPDTSYVKSQLRKAHLKDEFAAIEERSGYLLEGGTIVFDRVAYLPNPGTSLILGLLPKEDHQATKILEAEARLAAQKMKSINKLLYDEPQPWNLAMAVMRLEVDIDSNQAKQLLDDVAFRLKESVLMTVGGVKIDNDDLS